MKTNEHEGSKHPASADTLADSSADLHAPRQKYSSDELLRIVEKLAPEYHIPLQMHTNGCNYKEIAACLCARPGSVRNRIFQSLKKKKGKTDKQAR